MPRYFGYERRRPPPSHVPHALESGRIENRFAFRAVWYRRQKRFEFLYDFTDFIRTSDEPRLSLFLQFSSREEAILASHVARYSISTKRSRGTEWLEPLSIDLAWTSGRNYRNWTTREPLLARRMGIVRRYRINCGVATSESQSLFAFTIANLCNNCYACN